MKIGVIGMGVVGSAVYSGFAHGSAELKAFDINGKHDPITDLFGCDIVFGCTPTPTVNGKQDQSSLISTATILHSNGFQGVFVIKSTILPGTCDKLKEQFPGLHIGHNPEFLTAANPVEDFMKQDCILLSGEISDVETVMKAYSEVLPRATFSVSTDCKSTELAKYFHNTLLATKVSFCNEFNDVCQELGANYEVIREMAISQGRIGASHTRVPGPDGKSGFGGMCFVKDTAAFLQVAKSVGVDASIVAAAVKDNRARRPEAYNGEEATGYTEKKPKK